jgi:ubiquinone biosynthesis protein
MVTVMVTTTVLGFRLSAYLIAARLRASMSEALVRRSAKILASTLEQLGGTYVKFGQLLAMRADFLPPPYIEELAHLLDRVPPYPTAMATRIIQEELGKPLHELFIAFEDTPIASASFGQVYRARLPTGELTAVKVQRPGIVSLVRADLRIMAFLAWIADLTTILLTVKAREFYREFRSYTRQELDYVTEARNIYRIYVNSLDTPFERIPQVYWEYTSSRVLCMEYLDGVWVNDILAAIDRDDTSTLKHWQKEGVDFKLVAFRLTYIMLKQGFRDGVFHADPHAGNIVILDDNIIGLVDFGIVGMLSGDLQRHMLQLLSHMGEGSASGAFAAILRVLQPGREVNLRSFKRDYESNMQSWLDVAVDPIAGLREKSVARLIARNLSLIRRYGLHLPSAVARFYRALLIVDSVVIQLWPSINMVTTLRSALTEIQQQRLLRTLTPANYINASLAYEALALRLPMVLSEWADSGPFSEMLNASFSLDRGPTTARRYSGHAVAALMRTVGILLIVSGVFIIVARHFYEGVRTIHIANLHLTSGAAVTTFLLLGVISIWISRLIRGRLQ